MGSSGSGSFGDYPPSGGSGGQKPGGAPDDRCTKELTDIALEEVGLSAYFQVHNSLPKVGDAVTLRSAIKGSRLAVDRTDGVDVGLLPTGYNYLVACMKKGFSYSGEVTSSSVKPIESVRVTLRASKL
jgi:hypothetical protein